MLNTGDEDTLEEELLDIAGAKKQHNKQTTDDHDDYVI